MKTQLTLVRICALMATAALTACGGGSGDEAETSADTYYGVTGVKNGTSTTICLNGADFIDPETEKGKLVSRNIAAFYGLSGGTQTLSGTGQSCATKFPLATTVISVDYYNKVVEPGAQSASAPPAPDAAPEPDPNLYVPWTDNANGVVLKDGSNDSLSVRASDRALVFLNGAAGPTTLTGLSVNSSASILDGVRAIGTVTLANSTNGSRIAVLTCNNGSAMDIVVTSGWSVNCGGTVSGSGNTGGTSGNTGSGGGATRSFVTWTNSQNGVVVKDSQNESFAFYSDTKCLYSYNRQQETSNFCLGSGFSGNFAGQSVQVILAAATTGGCIAVLADPSGNQVDIFTSPTGVQTVTVHPTQWNSQGCTG